MPLETGRNAAWLQIDETRYTLLAGQEIQRRPLTQFAPAGSIGPAERPPENPALLAHTHARWDRGMATYKHNTLEGIDTFRRSSLDTRFAWGLLPPPRVDTLAPAPVAANTGGAGFLATDPVKFDLLRVGSGYFLYAYQPNVAHAYAYSGQAGTWTHLASGAQAVTRWRALTVLVGAVGQPGVRTSVDGTTFTLRDPSAWAGLVPFANRLWSFNAADGRLYNCTDPTLNIGAAGGGWVAQSEVLYLEQGETVCQLHTYRDRGGKPALYLVTSYRIWGYDDGSSEWELYEDLREEANPTCPLLVTWSRDKLLYAVPFGATGGAARHVYQFVGNVNEVGPTSRGGFDTLDSFDRFAALSGNVHWLYAVGERTVGAADNGEVVAMNDLGGWHTIYRPDEAVPNRLRAVCADGGNIYCLRQDGVFEVVRDRDDLTLPHLRAAPGGVDIRARRCYFGKSDWGMPNNLKIGAYVYLVCYLRDGSMGLPPGATLTLRYKADNGSWRMLPVGVPFVDRQTGTLLTRTGVGGVGTWPVRVTLPDGDCDNQHGLAFRELEMSVELQAVQDGDAPVLGELTVYGARWTDPRWAYQAVIDLREETVRPRHGNTLEHLSLGDARLALEAAIRQPRNHRITYGSDEFQTVVEAADIVLSGRENPVSGDGLFPITWRDISADCQD
jgi:hypothetical protein